MAEWNVWGRNPKEKLEDLLAESLPTEERAKEIASIARKNGWVDVRIQKFEFGDRPDFADAIDLKGKKKRESIQVVKEDNDRGINPKIGRLF